MDKLGKTTQTAGKILSQHGSKGVIQQKADGSLAFQRKLPYLNTIARDMVLCKNEQRRYAICVSSKGITVDQNACQEQFAGFMQCLGLTPKA